MTPETCPKLDNSLTEDRQALFVALDSRMKQVDQQWSEIWVEAADIASTVEASQLWKEGGFHSFNDWLVKSCPRSRSWVYLAMGIRKELRDIPDSELCMIPLGNADILKSLSTGVRSQLLKEARSKPPREFILDVMAKAPEQHMEKLIRRHFSYS